MGTKHTQLSEISERLARPVPITYDLILSGELGGGSLCQVVILMLGNERLLIKGLDLHETKFLVKVLIEKIRCMEILEAFQGGKGVRKANARKLTQLAK